MNVHHLELFYYVAKYEGITEAVRKMPYGIQQPAVSGQLLQLEKSLGVKLFNRRPFALTPEGERLYDFAYPFFSRLHHVEADLKGENKRHLRVAASASVIRTHLPKLLEQMKLRDQELKLTLREVEPSDVFQQLSDQQSDIAITVLPSKLSDGLRSELLLELPLVLVIPESWPAKSLKDLIGDDGMGRRVGKVPLIGLPPHEPVMQSFEQGLRQMGVHWSLDLEVGSLDGIRSYAAGGFGAGLGVGIPGVEPPEGTRQIVLDGFSTMKIGLLWQGDLRPMAAWLREEAVAFAARLRGE